MEKGQGSVCISQLRWIRSKDSARSALHDDRSARVHTRGVFPQYWLAVSGTGTGNGRMSGWNNSQSDDNDRFPPWNSALNEGRSVLRDCSLNQRRIMILTPARFMGARSLLAPGAIKKTGSWKKNGVFFHPRILYNGCTPVIQRGTMRALEHFHGTPAHNLSSPGWNKGS